MIPWNLNADGCGGDGNDPAQGRRSQQALGRGPDRGWNEYRGHASGKNSEKNTNGSCEAQTVAPRQKTQAPRDTARENAMLPENGRTLHTWGAHGQARDDATENFVYGERNRSLRSGMSTGKKV